MATPATGSAEQKMLPGETTASTTYKARLIAQHIVRCLVEHKNAGHHEPLMVALQGPQGRPYSRIAFGLTWLMTDWSTFRVQDLGRLR
jgi:hypothetical protein